MHPNAFHRTATALAIWTDIALRIPVAAARAVTPTAAERAEAERAATEKAVALEKGLWSVGVAWLELASAAMTGEVRTTHAALRAWADVASVFTTPGGRTTRADARRLGTPPPRRVRRAQESLFAADSAAWERSSER